MKRRARGRRRKNQQKRLLFIGGIAALAILAVFLVVYFSVRGAVDKVAKDVIWNNVYIENVDVSGMKAKEAKKALETQIEEYHKQTVELVADETKAEVSLGDLGFQMEDIDDLVKKAVAYGKTGSVWARHKQLRELKKEAKVFEPTYAVEKDSVKKTITEKIPRLENAAKDATITRVNGAFVVTDGKSGKKIELEKSIQNIATYFNKEWKKGGQKTIQLVTVVEEPNITKEDLLQVKDVLGTFSTYFGRGKSNREKNIINAATRINGALLLPGEELSASVAMGENTAENGYFEAGSYLDGEVVQSMGGGVCQVSTTLYNAVLLAELEITERFSHSMTVDYVKPSMDAAIAEGYKDLKIKNNTDAPVYIEGAIENGRVIFTVYGKETRSADRKVTYETEIVSTTPGKKKFVASADPVGTLKKTVTGHDAIKAKLWKIVTENGAEISRTVTNNSSYRSSTTTYAVGTGTDNAEALAILNAAIATQNEATINAAIAQAQAILSAVTE